MANLFTKLYDLFDKNLDAKINAFDATPIESLAKTEDLAKAMKADGYGRKGLLFDPFLDQSVQATLFKPRATYLSPHLLKQVSRRDPIVASIIDVRASQVSRACRRPTNRFDMGFAIIPKDRSIAPDTREIREIEEFILNCGQTKERSKEDRMTFDQWGYMITRDLMVYGHAAIEKVYRNDRALLAFLPLPGESIYYANKNVDKKSIDGMRDLWRQTLDEGKTVEDMEPTKEDPIEYVQVMDNKVIEAFTRSELVFLRFNLESDLDLNGYAVGPLERAIAAITSHMQIENHQRQFFTHGVASKGLLVVQGDVTPNSLKALQTQWNNQITGPMNAWRTPILAGIKGVQWVPLTASNRDMEYAAWQDYILRVIFAAFAMDPEEAGFGYLSKGQEQRTLSESSNEWKLTASRDRGLRPILTRIESVINEEILPLYQEDYSNKYHFVFVGLDAETQEEEIQRLTAETQLHTTLDEAREQAEMEALPFGGSLILNPLLLSYLEKNIPKGVFMETFMGVEGASEDPQFAYLPDPMWFQWQQIQMQMMQQAQGPTDDGGEGGPGGGGDEEEEDEGGGSEDRGLPVEQIKQMRGQGMSYDDIANQLGLPKSDIFYALHNEGNQDTGGDAGKDRTQAADQQQAAAQNSQKAAVEAYMAANPTLFKSLTANMQKHRALQKSMREPKRINTQRIQKITENLVNDFRKANDLMVKQILSVVKDDIDKKGK